MRSSTEHLSEIDAIGQRVVESYEDFLRQSKGQVNYDDRDRFLSCEFDTEVSFHLSRREVEQLKDEVRIRIALVCGSIWVEQRKIGRQRYLLHISAEFYTS